MPLKNLVELDDLTKLENEYSIPAYMHKEHRFCLPLLFFHQQSRDLPTPCDLILFDLHHDLARPHTEYQDKIQFMRQNKIDLDELIVVTNEVARQDDSDWILAGMELGLIRHLVTFGVKHKGDWEDKDIYVDHTGDEHQIHLLSGLPGELLGMKGILGDSTQKAEFNAIWKILQWEFVAQQGFQFMTNRHSFWLNIDLDCFILNWRGFQFPWLDEIYEKYFHTPSDYWTTRGLTGKSFFEQLFSASGLLTIAKEPYYCGGEHKSQIVFESINSNLFGGDLKIVKG